MLKGLFLFLKIAIIAAIGYWLAEQQGTVALEWLGWRIDAPVGVIVIAILVIVLVLYWIGLLIRAIRRAPKQFQTGRAASRREKGYKALTQGMVAVAAGDRIEAMKQSKKANALLNDPPLTMLLSAQAAQLNGDDQAANKYFEAMLDHPQAAFLGVRGLMTQAAKDGDQEKALELAKKAHRLRPDTPWVLTELLKLQDESEDWDGALKTVEEAMKAKALPTEEGKKRQAELYFRKAKKLNDEGNPTMAFNLAKRALKIDNSFAPAATLMSRHLMKLNKQRKAERVIEDTWRVHPTASLAYSYKELSPATDSLEQVKRFEKLTQTNPTHEESRYALARVAIDADLWGEARKQLAPLVDDIPAREAEGKLASPRLCRLMAELEEKEHHNMDKAHYWLEKAATDYDLLTDAEVES